MYGDISLGVGMEFASFDRDYVQKLAARDTEVERHFTSYFSDLLAIKLRTKLRSQQMADDVRQETFLRVIQTLRKEGGLQHPERLGAFVNSVCNNVLLETFRNVVKHGQAPEEHPEQADISIDLERDVVTRERKQAVERVLNELPAKDRDILRAILLEERDKDEICKELSVSSEYLRVLLHRAKARFRALMEKAVAHTFLPVFI
jgi:RNA polymerase sigma-70 factor (ECF subfamily)